VGALARALEASARVWLLDENGVLEPITAAGAGVPVGEGQVGLIAQRRESSHGHDKHGGVVFAGYPLLMEGRLLGVMAVSSGVPLSAAALQTLEQIAAQLALGIKRKQAEDELLRANAELDWRVKERTLELTRSLEELKEKEQELEKYAHHATHDVKEPLRNILVQTQKVTRTYAGQLPDKAMEWLDKVVTQGKRMQVLLERLKEYAQVNLGMKAEPVDCGAAVAVALASLESSVEESGAEVTVGDLPTLIGAQEHLTLLFQNLIGNALKYHSPDRPPRVEVGAQPHANGWLFWVRDNGVGIEPRYWQKIFGIAERLDAKASGWGYGLAICEKTVTRHGGRIWVASEPGQGSTFYFTLPAQTSEELS
jgi:signal transduction histidine kinase